jgi:hypothetical protein
VPFKLRSCHGRRRLVLIVVVAISAFYGFFSNTTVYEIPLFFFPVFFCWSSLEYTALQAYQVSHTHTFASVVVYREIRSAQVSFNAHI